MSKFNDLTGDRLSNTLKGDREAYAKGWDRIFNKESVLDDLVEISQETGQYNVEDVEVTINGEPVEIHMSIDDDLTKPLENALEKHRKRLDGEVFKSLTGWHTLSQDAFIARLNSERRLNRGSLSNKPFKYLNTYNHDQT